MTREDSAFPQHYLDCVAVAIGEADRPGRRGTLAAAGAEIKVSDWEREGAARGLQDSAQEPWELLVAAGLGLLLSASCGRSMVPIEFEFGELPEDLATHLSSDLEAGTSLLEQIQRVMNKLVGLGKMEEAKRLADFRHRIRKEVTAIQRLLESPEEVAEEAEARKETAALRIQQAAESEAEQEEKKAQRKAKRRAAFLQKEAADRRKQVIRVGAMGGAVALLALVWVLAVLVPKATQHKVPVLTMSDFSGMYQIVEIASRPPSLFVTVDSKEWQRLDEGAQRQLVDAVGKVLSEKQYSGAQFVDQDGTPVARWFKTTGTQIVVAREGGS